MFTTLSFFLLLSFSLFMTFTLSSPSHTQSHPILSRDLFGTPNCFTILPRGEIQNCFFNKNSKPKPTHQLSWYSSSSSILAILGFKRTIAPSPYSHSVTEALDLEFLNPKESPALFYSELMDYLRETKLPANLQLTVEREETMEYLNLVAVGGCRVHGKGYIAVMDPSGITRVNKDMLDVLQQLGTDLERFPQLLKFLQEIPNESESESETEKMAKERLEISSTNIPKSPFFSFDSLLWLEYPSRGSKRGFSVYIPDMDMNGDIDGEGKHARVGLVTTIGSFARNIEGRVPICRSRSGSEMEDEDGVVHEEWSLREDEQGCISVLWAEVQRWFSAEGRIRSLSSSFSVSERSEREDMEEENLAGHFTFQSDFPVMTTSEFNFFKEMRGLSI